MTDRNGPWLAERLRELGVDLAHIVIVGDRPRGHARPRCASWPREGVDLIVTSGGLGPTADDLTAEVVGASRAARWCSTRRWRGGSRRSSSRC